MTNKNIFSVFGIFALLVLGLGMVSAASLTISNIHYPSNILSADSSFEITFDLENTGAETNLDWSNSHAIQGTINSFIFSHDFIDSDELLHIVATANIPTGQSGNIAGLINAGIVNGGGDDKNFTFSVPIIQSSASSDTFCSEFAGEQGNLSIRDFDIDNLGEGDDETWNYLDEIEINVDVRNTGDEDVRDITVEIEIQDSDNNVVTGDFDLDDDTYDLGKINDRDTETATFKIDELPADIDDGTYRIYVRAYEEGNEDENCASTSSDLNGDDRYFEFDVESEYDEPAVVPRNGDINTAINAQAGEMLTVSFDIYNLGDQDEDNVLVTLENSNLGISESETFRNLDIGEKKQVSLTFTVPEDAEEGTYKLKVYTYFDYDDGSVSDEFSYDANSFDDLDEEYLINLNVLAVPQVVAPTIRATLDSESKVGQDLIITATVTNNGDDNNFVVSASDYSSWADLISVTPQTLDLNEDESAQVVITLRPKVSGMKSFNVNAVVDGETFEQSISVNVEGSAFSVFGEQPAVAYLAIGIILLLLLIIIVLAVKASRPGRKAEF